MGGSCCLIGPAKGGEEGETNQRMAEKNKRRKGRNEWIHRVLPATRIHIIRGEKLIGSGRRSGSGYSSSSAGRNSERIELSPFFIFDPADVRGELISDHWSAPFWNQNGAPGSFTEKPTLKMMLFTLNWSGAKWRFHHFLRGEEGKSRDSKTMLHTLVNYSENPDHLPGHHSLPGKLLYLPLPCLPKFACEFCAFYPFLPFSIFL